MKLNGQEHTITIWDTAGQEEFDHIRRLSYGNANAFLVCYSTVDKTSLRNIRSKWIKELNLEGPHVPKFLVGTMADRKNEEKDKGKDIPTKSEVQKLVKDLNFVTSMECSAKTDPKGVDAAFMKCFESLTNDRQSSASLFSDCFDCFPFTFCKK